MARKAEGGTRDRDENGSRLNGTALGLNEAAVPRDEKAGARF